MPYAITPSMTKGNKSGTSGKTPAGKVSGKKAASTQSGSVTIRVGSKTANLPIAELDQAAIRSPATWPPPGWTSS